MPFRPEMHPLPCRKSVEWGRGLGGWSGRHGGLQKRLSRAYDDLPWSDRITASHVPNDHSQITIDRQWFRQLGFTPLRWSHPCSRRRQVWSTKQSHCVNCTKLNLNIGRGFPPSHLLVLSCLNTNPPSPPKKKLYTCVRIISQLAYAF